MKIRELLEQINSRLTNGEITAETEVTILHPYYDDYELKYDLEISFLEEVRPEYQDFRLIPKSVIDFNK